MFYVYPRTGLRFGLRGVILTVTCTIFEPEPLPGLLEPVVGPGGQKIGQKPRGRIYRGIFPEVLISLKQNFKNQLLEGVKSQFRIQRFHLDTLRVAEVVPHLGLPVRGPFRRRTLILAFPEPGGPDFGPGGQI